MGFMALLTIIAIVVFVCVLVVTTLSFGNRSHSARNLQLALFRNHTQLKKSSIFWNTLVEWTGCFSRVIRGCFGSAVSGKTKTKPCMKRTSSYNSFPSTSARSTSHCHSIYSSSESNQYQPPSQKRRVVFASQPNGAVVTEHFYYNPWSGSPAAGAGRYSSQADIPFGSPVGHTLPRVSLANRQKTPPPRRAAKVTRKHLSVPASSFAPPTYTTEKENSHIIPSNFPPTAMQSYKTVDPTAEPWRIQFQKQSFGSTSVTQRRAGTGGRIPLRSSNSTSTTGQQKLLSNLTNTNNDVNRAQTHIVSPPLFKSPSTAPPIFHPNGWSPTVAVHQSIDQQPMASEDQATATDRKLFTPPGSTQLIGTLPFWNSPSWHSPTH